MKQNKLLQFTAEYFICIQTELFSESGIEVEANITQGENRNNQICPHRIARTNEVDFVIEGENRMKWSLVVPGAPQFDSSHVEGRLKPQVGMQFNTGTKSSKLFDYVACSVRNSPIMQNRVHLQRVKPHSKKI